MQSFVTVAYCVWWPWTADAPPTPTTAVTASAASAAKSTRNFNVYPLFGSPLSALNAGPALNCRAQRANGVRALTDGDRGVPVSRTGARGNGHAEDYPGVRRQRTSVRITRR